MGHISHTNACNCVNFASIIHQTGLVLSKKTALTRLAKFVYFNFTIVTKRNQIWHLIFPQFGNMHFLDWCLWFSLRIIKLPQQDGFVSSNFYRTNFAIFQSICKNDLIAYFSISVVKNWRNWKHSRIESSLVNQLSLFVYHAQSAIIAR